MAAVQWSGGKMHGSVEAKASMLHDDKVMRLHHSHSNPDIDLSKTKQNFSLRELTYAQKCERYDALMENVKIKRKSSGKNANVTLQKLVIPIPAGMQHDDNIDMQMFRQWTADVGSILQEEYGDLLIDIDAHVDEVHLYLDSRKDETDDSRYTWSRAHLHAAIVPAVWEPVKGADGKPMKDETGKPVRELCLNSTKFSNKRNIIRLNNRIQEMTQQKYHMLFMDGTGVGKKHNTVEEMKALSAEELRDAGYQIVRDKAEIKKARTQLDAQQNAVAAQQQQNQDFKQILLDYKAKQDARRDRLNERIELLNDREMRLTSAEKSVSEQQAKIDADRESFAAQQKESADELEKQAQALTEEHQKVQEQAQGLDEILNPEQAFERAAGVVMQLQKMAPSPKDKSACGDVLLVMKKVKKQSNAKEVIEFATKPVTGVWEEAARQQREAIAASERRIAEIVARTLPGEMEDEDSLDLPRR